MGLSSPFPEPESPELDRYAICTDADRVGLLRAMQVQGIALNAYVEPDGPIGVVRLLEVDPDAGRLVLAGPPEETLRGPLLAAERLTFVGFVDGVKLQFTSPRPGASGRGAGASFTIPVPQRLLRLERRATARLRAEDGRAAVCRIPLPGGQGERETLRVLDVGAGGIALLAYPARFEPEVGAEFDDCHLDLPGVGGATVSLRVRHLAMQQDGDRQATCCGCEFVRMTPGVQGMLARFAIGRRAGSE
jgi:c-di-GMP-binding flagellar brake protein YcgR